MTTPMRNPDFIYKIASAEAFAAAQASGTFTGMPIDEKDGYIHFSTAKQLGETLSLHFKGQTGLVLFSVRSFDMGSKLKWEPSRGGQLFPHIYGPLPLDAVVAYSELHYEPDGSLRLPVAG